MSYDFQMVRKGYNPDEVDAYIEELENQLNEYKEKSSTINKAIINAQIAADNIIKAAHSETEKILSQAKKEATDLKQATINQIKYLKLNIANQKNLINNFRRDYEFLTEKYLNPLVTSDTDKVFDKLTEIEQAIDEISSPGDRGYKGAPSLRKPEKKYTRRDSVSEDQKRTVSEIPSENSREDKSNEENEQINNPEHNNDNYHTTSLTLEETRELLS
ncbi:MAG: DivIVA domain-containing protein [Clostridiales bacterium]|nr:DivIVA domain-containing protein [Clostridiales bacterium]